jgi:hypothetical protein
MKRLLLALVSVLVASAAHPVTITRTLDFQDNPPGLNGRVNFDYGGLRFSPRCNIHNGHGNEGQIWLQSERDNSNCDAYAPGPEGEYLPGQNPNRDFLGLEFEDFYVDRFGKEFTLLGLAGVAFDGTVFDVVSSKGGVFHGFVPFFLCCDEPYVLPYKAFTLTGPEWTDITWLTLTNLEPYGHQQHHGWDDIRYSFTVVNEPPTWALLLTLPANLLGCGLNDIYDFESDRRSERRRRRPCSIRPATGCR